MLNNDKCSNHEFYDFLLFYCLILLRLLATFPELLPPPCSMHFSPLLCASAACLSHLRSPCCVHPLFLLTTPICMFAIYLSPPPAVLYSLPVPLPQHMHLSCIFLCFCCARVFSQQLLQAFKSTPSSVCLSFLFYLFQLLFVYLLSLLIFILFFLLSF